MSYWSQISYYKQKIRDIETAKPFVSEAINHYKDALSELNKIIGVRDCEEFKKQILSKISELNAELANMNQKIKEYQAKIDYYEWLQAEEERAAREAAAKAAAEKAAKE